MLVHQTRGSLRPPIADADIEEEEEEEEEEDDDKVR